MGRNYGGLARLLGKRPGWSDAFAQDIIESTVDAVIILDAKGCVRAFNASAERIFGRRREDVLGRELGPLVVPPEHLDAHRRRLRRAVETGDSHIIGRPVELPALRADGSRFPAEITLSRLRGEGPAMFVGHVRDITERLEGEAAAHQFAGLVESSADAIVGIRLDGRRRELERERRAHLWLSARRGDRASRRRRSSFRPIGARSWRPRSTSWSGPGR